MAPQADTDEPRGDEEAEASEAPKVVSEGEGEGVAEPAKRPAKARKKSKAKGSDTAASAPKEEAAKAAPRRDMSYLMGHAVIWVGVLGAVAYLMAKGR